MFLHVTLENWSLLVHFLAYSLINEPKTHLQVSVNETVFHTQARIPLKFQLNLSGNQFRESTAQ